MKLEEDISEFKAELDALHIKMNNMNEEIREKEESMFELSGKNYNLELRVQAKEGEKNQKVSNLNEDWSSKYEGMVDEYEQRL